MGFYRTVCRFFPAEACLIVFIEMVGYQKNLEKTKKKSLERISQAKSKNQKNLEKTKKNKGLERISQATFPSGDWFFCFFLFFSILGFYRTVCRFFPAEACLIVFIVMVGSLHHFHNTNQNPSLRKSGLECKQLDRLVLYLFFSTSITSGISYSKKHTSRVFFYGSLSHYLIF